MLPNKISIINPTVGAHDGSSSYRIAKMILVELFTPADKNERCVPTDTYTIKCRNKDDIVEIHTARGDEHNHRLDVFAGEGFVNQLTPILKHALFENIPVRIKHYCNMEERENTLNDLVIILKSLAHTLKHMEEIVVSVKDDFTNDNSGYERFYQLLDGDKQVHTFLDYESMVTYKNNHTEYHRSISSKKRCKLLDKRIVY